MHVIYRPVNQPEALPPLWLHVSSMLNKFWTLESSHGLQTLYTLSCFPTLPSALTIVSVAEWPFSSCQREYKQQSLDESHEEYFTLDLS